MDNVDLRLLRLFDAIARTASLSKAAEALGLTQPGASLALRRLRAHFGDPLFVRTSGGMEATPLADGLAPLVRQAIAALDATLAYRTEFVPADSDRLFRLRMTDVGQIVMLPPLLDRLSRAAPNLRIEVQTIDRPVGKALETGECDLALGFVDALEDAFFGQTLFEERFVCLAREGHPRIGARLTRRRYEAESHVVVATTGTGHRLLDRTLETLQVRRKVAARIPSFLGLATLIGATDHLCTLPNRAADLLARSGGVRVLALPFEVPGYAVRQHWHARQAQDPGNRWLRKVLAELFAGR